MCNIKELIKRRRSIRRYKKEVPSEELIKECLLCAIWAPSPLNVQPVRYIRIVSDDVRKKIWKSLVKGKEDILEKTEERTKKWIKIYWERYCKFMFEAPVLFAVCVKKEKKMLSERLLGHPDRSLDISVGLSLSNFILRAEELGLGTCILTAPFLFVKNIEDILGIKDLSVRCFLTLGFPEQIPDPPERYPVSEIYRKI